MPRLCLRGSICGSIAVAALWIVAARGDIRAAQVPPVPEAQTLRLEGAVSAAARLPRLTSLVVSWRGTSLLERYYHGGSAARLANLKSASKSVLSALVGIALDRRLLTDVKQPIGSFFADLNGQTNRAKQVITIENLITMQSGLASTSNRNYGAWVQSRNWVRYVLTRPLANPPGSEMDYSTGNTHLLSAILTKVTGASTWKFAQDALARPLGFSLARWPQDPQGIYFGGNDMLMTSRQMVAFGELYLNRGNANGKQIVSGPWVDASFVPRSQSRRSGQGYGYGWWIRELAGHTVYYAWGYGGQFIFVVPDLELVTVTTSITTDGEERHDHLNAIYELVGRTIIEPLASIDRESALSGLNRE